jgi:hypothetical protein
MTITSESNADYLLIRSVASLKDENDLIQHAMLVFDEYKKHDNKKVVLDGLATEFPSDLFPYYDLVQFYMEKFPPEVRDITLACIISPEYTRIGKFWETVSNNRGFKYRAFTSLREAEEWLMGE